MKLLNKFREMFFPENTFERMQRLGVEDLAEIKKAAEEMERGESYPRLLQEWEHFKTLRKKGVITNDFIKDNASIFTKEWLIERGFLDESELMELSDKYVSTHSHFFKSVDQSLLPDSFKLKHIGRFDIESAAFTSKDGGFSLEYFGDKYVRTRASIAIKSGSDLYTLGFSQMEQFSVVDGYIVVNNFKSPFQLNLSEADIKTLWPLFLYMGKIAADNADRRRDAEIKALRDAGKHSAVPEEKKTGINPWLAGVLGFGFGALVTD